MHIHIHGQYSQGGDPGIEVIIIITMRDSHIVVSLHGVSGIGVRANHSNLETARRGQWEGV